MGARHGHLEGDLVLKNLARILKEEVPPGGYEVRFAGDEFIVFLEGMDGDAGERVAEDLRERVAAKPFPSDNVPGGIELAVSVGVAAVENGNYNAQDLLERADKALYEAKSQGRNRVIVHKGGELHPLSPSEPLRAAHES